MCKHHQYDPASGEPIAKKTLLTQSPPCPYCWQARAQWLEDKVRFYQIKADADMNLEAYMAAQERIAELEKQLES